MNKRPTSMQWLALVLGLASLGGVLAVRHFGGIAGLTQDDALIRLQTERQQLDACSDQAVAAAKTEAERRSGLAGTLTGPEGWKVDENGTGSVTTFTHRGPLGWPDLVQAIGSLLARPGARITSLEIHSRGSRQVREIASVEVIVAHPTETPSRPEAPDGNRFPGSGPTASPTAIGPDPPLRLPSASAGPPASGQAPSRLDPTPVGPGPASTHHSTQDITMTTLTLQLPEPVAAEYYAAAEELNQRFGQTEPKIDAKGLMAFALARYTTDDVCAQFDLALRLVHGPAEKPFNPVLP